MIIEIISLVVSVVCLAVSIICLISIKKVSLKDNIDVDVDKIINEIHNASKSQNELNHQLNSLILHQIKDSNDTLLNSVSQNNRTQFTQQSEILTRLNSVLQNNDQSMKNAITTLENGLSSMRQDNEKKLEQMRQTVDEKLNVSLENRLTNSFNIINERLQSVYEGIGVMKQLATGVGDLKKVLTNVKTRGTWGEVQLESLLE